MPASRSARAMILAPRSCPSRPGFATTTRIFFSGGGAIERFAPSRGRHERGRPILWVLAWARPMHRAQARTGQPAYLTVTVSVMNGWIVHIRWYVPFFLKVTEYVPLDLLAE